jgi:hypothetical protein
MGGEAGHARWVAGVADQGHEVIDPPLDVGLPHAQLYPAVEHLHHRHRVNLAAVDAADRDRAAAANRLDRDVQRVEPVHRRDVGDFLRHAAAGAEVTAIACDVTVSMDAERAARQIIGAVRQRRPEIILTPAAQLVSCVAGLAPGLTSQILRQVQRIALPAPPGQAAQGGEPVPGHQLNPALPRKAFGRLTALGQAAANRYNERPQLPRSTLTRAITATVKVLTLGTLSRTGRQPPGGTARPMAAASSAITGVQA